MLLADTSFLGLDSTAWTALATITALALGLWGVLGSAFVGWFKQPDLKLGLDRIDHHTTDLRENQEIAIRIPVVNNKGKNAANSVEVFVERISKWEDATKRNLFPYLPMRLTWTHSHGCVSEPIPGGAARLLDLGVLIFHMGWSSQRDDLQQNPNNPLLFTLSLEMDRYEAQIYLPPGSYEVQILMVHSGSESKRTQHKFTIFDHQHEYPAPASRYLKIDPA